MVQGQSRLDQPGCACGRLGMADLRLDRTEGAPGTVCFSVDLAQCRNLDRVADPGAGAVRLDESYALRGDS